MKVRSTIFLIAITGLISCHEKTVQKNEPSIIDRQKIDKVFGNDVSQVLFDHLYVVLDSVSYAEFLGNGSWKSTYAAIDKGLPDFKYIDDTTSSCYLRGHEHFIELLGPNNAHQEPVGKSGIGFSLRNKGEHFHLGVVPKLKQAETPYLSLSETVAMPLEEKRTTWFKAFYSPSTGTALHTWYAFYNPVFLDSLNDNKHQEYSREAFLKQLYSKERLFKGVRSITMSCTIKDYKRIVEEMRQLGRRLIRKEENTLTIASGDVSITIIPSDTIAFSHITQIQCALNHTDESVTKLGNLTITNSGTKSIWDLEELYKNNP